MECPRCGKELSSRDISLDQWFFELIVEEAAEQLGVYIDLEDAECHHNIHCVDCLVEAIEKAANS